MPHDESPAQDAALLLVDVQVDFCPGGALPVADGDQIIPVLNRWIDAACARGLPVYASRDWHPLEHGSFRDNGGLWPVHCLQDSSGAGYHPELRLPADVIKVSKGVRFDQDQYSPFDQTGLATLLRKRGIKRLFVGGLAEEYSVLEAVLDGCREGFEMLLILDGTRALSRADGEQARRRMVAAGAQLIEAGSAPGKLVASEAMPS